MASSESIKVEIVNFMDHLKKISGLLSLARNPEEGSEICISNKFPNSNEHQSLRAIARGLS